MRAFSVLSTQSSSLDGHVIADDGVEVLPHVVIAWLAWLHTADLICGPRHDVIPPRLGLPDIRPAHPHPALAWLFELRRMSALAAIQAHLHLGDGATTAPGQAADDMQTSGKRVLIVPTAARGTPVNSPALRIMASSARQGLRPVPLKGSK
jgi:hypothetical protein